MRRGVVIIGAVFAVALAVAVASRMSADAMAVVVGVVCGVLASIPTSLLLLWMLARRAPGTALGAERAGQAGMGNYFPPVVVVNPGPGYGTPAYGPSLNALPAGSYPAAPPLPGGRRSFKVVGDEETMLDELRHVFPGLVEEWAETPQR